MSFSNRHTIATIFRYYRTICDQLQGFRALTKPGNALAVPESSLGVQGGCRHRLGVNLRGILCLSRLLYDRTFKPARKAGFYLSENRVRYPNAMKKLWFFNKSLEPTAALTFSESSSLKLPLRDISGSPQGSSGDGDNNEEQQPLRLMDYNEIIWPRPWKSIRNYLFSFLISSYFDEKFSISSFLTGAEQAVDAISHFVSNGQFEALEGLVTREAIQEVRQNYMRLTQRQRNFVAVNPKDFFSKFVFEIGIILDDDTNERFVEITTVFQGFHGLDELKVKQVANLMEDMYKSPEQMYICNYRFIREFTKGKDDDWTVNKLNHFIPTELARR